MAKITLKDVAKELNKVMSYGIDPDTGKVIDKKEMIDTGMCDVALEAEIVKRAQEDLRESDKPDFSPEAWAWFVDKELVPATKKKTDKENKKTDAKPKNEDKKTDSERERGDKNNDRENARERGNHDRNDKGHERDTRNREETRGKEREREKQEQRSSRSAKNESYVSAAFRIAEDCVKKKVKSEDYVYEMCNGLAPLYAEAGITDKKYVLDRACVYVLHMFGALNTPAHGKLMKDNQDLLK